ncbi:MAG: ABC transporter substrate-binding protein [Flavobacteriales bacterium]|nr:ABC transporter substrate-binding protein [Flavobacteriales bacterium]
MRLLAFLSLATLLVACSQPEKAREREGKGGKYYGGVFNANEAQELRGLFPLGLVQAASHRIAAQVYEGLVRFDQKDLSIKPALADSWTMDETGTVYTFRLHPGVRFHDDTCFADGVGREFTAQDVVESFTALCSHDPLNQLFWLFQDKVLGANAQYAATVSGKPSPGVKGVEAVDPLTVRITLTAPWPSFLQILAHQGTWIFPKELVAFYGAEAQWHMVGTGPFRLKTHIKGEVLVLERFSDYWGKDEEGNSYPFLDAVRYTFVKDKLVELEEFQGGHLSVIYELPVDRTDVLSAASGSQVQTIPGLTVQFYGFNMRTPTFTDVRVRRAFSMAIDRQLLVDSVLNGLAVPATRGVVAPGFEDYPYQQVPTVAFDPQAAKRLLAEAGYADGKGFPAVHIQVNNDGFGYVRIAERVQAMLEQNLGVRVVTSVLPADQHYERVEMGRAQFWREGWIVDHPDPENFLALFYGKSVPADTTVPSYLNSTRYKNARFDSLFTEALRTAETSKRMDLLARAERQMMEDMVVVPLYHERSVRLLQPWVRDLPINGMEYRDLRGVWFDPEARTGH